MTTHSLTHLACNCGKVRIAVKDAPIVSVECHCKSCCEAGETLRTLPEATDVREDNGGTRFVLYRKDRVRFDKGPARLKAFRLTPQASTRRVVAACCNTPVFLEFKNGHWLSLYARLWPAGTVPPLEMRTMTEDREDASPLPEDVPNASMQSFSFMVKLMGAWIAMGFKVPKVAVEGDLHV